MKIAKCLEESGLETKEQRTRFLGKLLGISGALLLRNMIAVKRVKRTGEGEIRTRQDFWMLMMWHTLLVFELNAWQKR